MVESMSQNIFYHSLKLSIINLKILLYGPVTFSNKCIMLDSVEIGTYILVEAVWHPIVASDRKQ